MRRNNNQYGHYESVANRIAVGVLLIIISLLSLLSLVNAMGGVGQMIKSFLVGTFGLVAYAYAICGMIIGIAISFGKRITLAPNKAFKYISLFLLGVMILHVWNTRGFIIDNKYGGYLSTCYQNSTPAGLLTGIITYPFMKLITPAFFLVVLLILFFGTALASFYPLLRTDVKFKTKKVKIKPSKSRNPVLTDIGNEGREEQITTDEVGNSLFIGTIEENGTIPEIKPASKKDKKHGFNLLFPNQNDPLLDEDKILEPIFDNNKNRKMRAREKLFGKKQNKYDKAKAEAEKVNAREAEIMPSHREVGNSSLPFTFNTEMGNQSKLESTFHIDKSDDAIKKEVKERYGYILDKDLTKDDIYGAASHRLAEPIRRKDNIDAKNPDEVENLEQDIPKDMPFFIKQILYDDRKTAEGDSQKTEPKLENRNIVDNRNLNENRNIENVTDDNNESQKRGSIYDLNIFNNSDIKKSKEDKFKNDNVIDNRKNTRKQSSYTNDFPIGENAKKINVTPQTKKKHKTEQISIEQKLKEQEKRSPYMAPPISLLKDRSDNILAEDYSERVEILERTLQEFKIDAKVIGVTQGPTFSRFELRMPVGVSVNQVLKLENDIAMKLRASPIRIEAPIPGRDAFGIEVPNMKRSIVGLRSIIGSENFNIAKSPLTFCLGKDISNDNFVCDLESMPHLLIAGATGTGKSVCINSLIISLLYRCGPKDLKLVLVDPKKVELSLYSGLPHLLLPEVIDEPEIAINALDWAIEEMRSRFNLFKKYQVRNIKEYNKIAIASKDLEKIPRVVFIIDELADFILIKKREIEDRIGKLTRLSRAAGIHLVVATQRPSVDIVTGTIKSNLPSRIAFAVKTTADSSTILGGGGAEKLLGKGDMLYVPQSLPEPLRLQGTFVDRDEVKSVVDYIKNNNDTFFDKDIEQRIYAEPQEKQSNSTNNNTKAKTINGDSELFVDALRMFVEEKQASISKLQRKFNVGYGTAANIVEEMEERNYVSPNKGGNRTRDVLISMEEFNKLYGNEDEDLEEFKDE